MNSEHDSWPKAGIDPLIDELQSQYIPNLQSVNIEGLLTDERIGRRAIVSSFGAQSAVLLHYVSSIIPDIEVIFLDTEKHFAETLEYRDEIASSFGLNITTVKPDQRVLKDEDPDGQLHQYDPDGCCTLRKTFPLKDSVIHFDSWITGRKRFQSDMRANLPIIEREDGKLKINPLALWNRGDIDAYISFHEIPMHPLVAQNYLSIGCAPCTRPVKAGEDERRGRWADFEDKTECGIHLGPDGRFVRSRNPVQK